MKAVGEQSALQTATGGGTFPRFRDALVRTLLAPAGGKSSVFCRVQLAPNAEST